MQPTHTTFDFFSGTYVPGIDELFEGVSAPKAATRPRVTCLVCGLTLEPDAERPRLCHVCGGDLPTARGHVVTLLFKAELRVDATMDAWSNALDAADPTLQARWRAFYEAQSYDPERAAVAVKLARSNRADAFLDLVRLYLDYQDAGEQLAQVNTWVDRCCEVLG